ncbi:MAG: hypothetical protein RLZZ196_717 [Bacteroidota bacterium]|jgi:hypothetical protein
MAKKCMKCGGSMKNYQSGGSAKKFNPPSTKPIGRLGTNPFGTNKKVVKITEVKPKSPVERDAKAEEIFKKWGTIVDSTAYPKKKTGGSTSSFAKLAPPYNKATYADKIAGAKKSSMKKGGMVKKGK